MKLETVIYDELKKVIPDKSVKTVLFAKVAKTNYEMFFYSYFKGEEKPIYCFTLAENDKLDENVLDAVFEKIAKFVRDSEKFQPDKNNIITYIIEQSGIDFTIEYFDKDKKIFEIKKEWKIKNLL